MNLEKRRIGAKNFIVHVAKDSDEIDVNDVINSWKTSIFNYWESKSETEIGLRSAQLGAIFAIKSHWTVSNSAATIVMPTGTGKTEAMIATVISECRTKTCIVVPSNLLRKQTIDRFCTIGKLREIGVIDDSFLSPFVACLESSPINVTELEELVSNSNIIVTTMSLLNSNHFTDEFIKILSSNCDTLIIDEAHHLPASSWNRVKKTFNNAVKCLQFTATPFRNDGKKIDGEIIYNFPLSIAQERGYFKPINFYPTYEFDSDKKDYAVAAKAVELLEADIGNGFPHLLLVRASTQNRAKDLFDNVYERFYSKHHPVLVVSSNSPAKNKEALQKVRENISRIIVCVDMFSEGIDIPQLKICAIHDKYKSLPITIQFIGRFARTETNLGKASVVANIVDDDIKDSLEELYSQDSDWNKILKNVSEEKIGSEVEFQKMASGFTGKEIIPLIQIRPKISMFMYKTTEVNWNWRRWSEVFNEEHTHHFVNKQEKILIITELCSSNVDWTTSRDITDENWNLHLLYWNEKKGVFFINTTNKGIADRLAKAVFNNCERVSGEEVFRCLSGINRLMLSTVGLKTAISNHHIRYRMFAGVDVGEGITQATKSTATKSNLFGVGYENGKYLSIGCSYKGTIWAKWVETINYWKNWCDKQAEKILDSTIDTRTVLNGALVTEKIITRPEVVPYRIDFPLENEAELRDSILLKTNYYDVRPYLVDIGLTHFDETSPLSFYVGNEDFREEFVLDINETGYAITHKSGHSIGIVLMRSREIPLVEFLSQNPPTIWFVDGSSLEGNLLLKLKNIPTSAFPDSHIMPWNWNGTNICKESQRVTKEKDSIQFRLISELKNRNKYKLIFDDDGSGEVADVIAVKEDDANNTLLFEFYHCKFSGAPQAGSRVDDLYDVCGQAEKSIKWLSDTNLLVERLINR
ncbi:MAG: DEAD/DEAH box helicase, partial [Clostridia bacterium]